MRFGLRALVAPLFALFLLGAAPAHAAIEVAASFSILGDLARQVGGERVQVDVLVGPDEDAHGFQPRPSDARRLGKARVVIANGLGFDPWIERLAKSAGASARLVVASRGVATLETKDEHDHGHGHADDDPHAWQNVVNVERYVDNIAAALIAADPEGADIYRANAARYTAELRALDAEIRAAVASLPPARRRVATSHDAFAYFAHAYGIEFLAAAGVSSHTSPSARAVSRLITRLRDEGIPAVFLENVSDRRLLDRIAAESGARIGGTLYSDALSGGDGPAPSYVRMMRHNLRTLMAELAPAR